MIWNHRVKILKTMSESAGNKKIVTSETIRNKTAIKTENIKFVSIHVPTHLKPINDTQLGYYLAGLIDGDGHFSSKQQLVIIFNLLDIQLAYFIKKQLGFGIIRKVKNKNAVLLIIASSKGLEKVLHLVNGKLRSFSKIDQINKNILSDRKYTKFNKTIKISLNLNNNLDNYWLAGFSDADASFQINVVNCKNKTEVRLNYQIDQKNYDLLILIKKFLGGNIGYRKSQDTYYYGSISFGSARKVINYFDQYHLQSTKHINYLKWRKTYLLIQEKKHLTVSGLEKIYKLKNTMNRFSDNVAV